MIELFPQTSEPSIEEWVELDAEELAAQILARATAKHYEQGRTGPVTIALNGRSGAGKTTFSKQLLRAAEASGQRAVRLEADDVMWCEPMWQWAKLAEEGIFRPISQDQPVDFVPPQWRQRGRDGSIAVPAGTDVVVWEGVGSSQVALVPYLDYSIWVQSDHRTARRLGLARDTESGVNGDPEESERFWDQWIASEREFLEADRPWDRADALVLGVSELPNQVGQRRSARASRGASTSTP